MPSLKSRVIRGTAWIVGFRLGQRVLGLASTLILVRLLAPADFGIVAMGLAVAAIFEALSSLGFSQALIQFRSLNRHHLDTAWTINQIVSFVAAALLLAISPFVAQYYKEERVVQVLAVIAFSTALTGVHNFVGMALHEREFRFGPVFLLTMGSRVISTIVTLVAAFIWSDYRALLVGLIALAISRTALSFFLSPYRPRWDLSASREMLAYGKWLLLNNLISAIASRGQDALVGRSLGADAAGTFSVAGEVASLPTTELVLPLMRAVYPAFVKIRDDGGRLLVGFEPVLATVFLLVIPAAVGIASISDLIVSVALGSKWIAAGPILEVLVVLASLQAGRAVIDPVFLAVGKPRVVAAASATYVIVGFPLFFFLLGQSGLPLAAWGLVFGGLASFLFGVGAALHEIHGNWLMLARASFRPLCASVVMMGALTLARASLAPPADSYAAAGQLLALVALGALSYSVTIYVQWRISGSPEGAERRVLEVAMAAFGRFYRTAAGRRG